MGTLAHVFEATGLSTVAFGSIEAHLVGIAPPRGLFCDFPLGRPLGRPGDPAFQHRVLAQALELLETATAPTVASFPEAIHDDEGAALACPLPPRFDPDAHPAVDEARALRSAYDRAVARHGNRVGAGRAVAADDIPAALEAFARVAEGTPWKEAGIAGIPARVAQDVRGYYETAALVLIEHSPEAWQGARWFLERTEAGRTIRACQRAMRDAGVSRNVWFYLTPGGA